MTDYTPELVTEMDVRNFVTPPIDYNDVSREEILLKIESVETYVKQVFFDGGSLPTASRIGILLLIIPSILSSPDLAKKYRTLSSEKLGDYAYSISQPMSRGTAMQSDPFAISKTWHQMGLEIITKLSSSNKFNFRVTNSWL